MTELNSSNCENAIKNKADNYKTFLTVTIIATSLELIGLIFLVYWELKERSKGKPSSEQIIETKKKEIDKLFEEKNKARNVVNIKTTKEELRKQQEELKKQEEEKVAKEIQDYKEQKQVDFENKHNDQNTNNNSSGNQPRIKTENKRIRPFGRKFNRNIPPIPPLDLPRGIFPIKQEKEFNYFPQKDSVDKDKGSFFNQDDGDQTEYYSADEDDVDDDSQLP
jgi:type IV secretory pathway VirB10-like protein